ncbi:RES domain-containing protein [Sphingobium sp. OAS761]|uniref:RES family NAD+ phosphorylase n=1 Tax=Sphingobium sp. OAS761 TaxID=2817901 RepID=UPI0020A19BCF|nr:RES family NAD+ phosphorylase [Sphingobium sp. OAS761]MCP1471904.1 RES domain-containing protein [Sphingobium sp. OAS761]
MREEPAFASWRSYWNFAREVSHQRRYLLSSSSRAFLDELIRTSEKRQSRLPAGHRLCRAQVAHGELDDPDVGPLPRPAPPARMVPLPYSASDGRANPRGIPCLYMADDRHTAIAEVRPWIGSLVSVAIMRTLKDQRLVDVRDDSGRQPIYLEGEPSPDEREAAVWSHVARAFREPVLREDNRAGYASTQIIAEAFRNHGYDGIAYGSAFGEGRTNIVLFDIGAAELEACELHEIKNVQLIHEETENPYFVQKAGDGTTSLVRNVITAIGPIDGPMTPLTSEPDAS